MTGRVRVRLIVRVRVALVVIADLMRILLIVK